MYISDQDHMTLIVVGWVAATVAPLHCCTVAPLHLHRCTHLVHSISLWLFLRWNERDVCNGATVQRCNSVTVQRQVKDCPFFVLSSLWLFLRSSLDCTLLFCAHLLFTGGYLLLCSLVEFLKLVRSVFSELRDK